MPATEKTWRDQARMHVIFGISSLVMLGGTITPEAAGKFFKYSWKKTKDDRTNNSRDTIEF